MGSKTRIALLILLTVAAITLYLGWSRSPSSDVLLSDLRENTTIHYGIAQDAASNLLALNMRLTPADYQTPARLSLKVDHYLAQAQREALLSAQTVVALPEHIGTGLFAVDEKPEVQQARTLRDAMQWMGLSHPFSYVWARINNHSEDPRTEAVLRIKSSQMAEDYQRVFSGLAKKYNVVLVAGSIVLPEPYIKHGRIKTSQGPLQQMSAVFDADGQLLSPLIYKNQLSRYERRYSQSPKGLHHASLNQVNTSAGVIRVYLGCDVFSHSVPNDGRVVIIGAPAHPAEDCRPINQLIPLGSLRHLPVETLGLPWNLIGSPKKPEEKHASPTSQLVNIWQPAATLSRGY